MTTDFINARPDVAKRFAAAWAKAIDYIKANPAEARKHLAQEHAHAGRLVDIVPMLGYIMVKDMTPKDKAELAEVRRLRRSRSGSCREEIDVTKYLKSF